MDEKKLRGLLRLVRLQVPDKMERGAREPGNGGGLTFHLLDIVFAKIAQACRVAFEDRLGAEDLRDCEQTDRRRCDVLWRMHFRCAPAPQPVFVQTIPTFPIIVDLKPGGIPLMIRILVFLACCTAAFATPLVSSRHSRQL